MNIANQSSTYVCSPEYSFTGDRTSSARILVGINVCFCFIAIVGNVMASMAVFSTRSLNISYHYFLCSLTVAELILVLVGQPLLISLILAQLNSTCIHALQLTFLVFARLGIFASTGTVTLIALNTCLYVCGKFNYTNTITSRKKDGNCGCLVDSWCNVRHDIRSRFNIRLISVVCDFLSLLRDCFVSGSLTQKWSVTVMPPKSSRTEKQGPKQKWNSNMARYLWNNNDFTDSFIEDSP